MNNSSMSAPLSRWIKEQKPFSYGMIACLAMLSLTFIALLTLNISNAKELTASENRYGQQVTNMAANKLRLAMANNDLISMQAELNELTQQETVYSAIIYDLNNTPKVQSGIAFDRLYLEGNHSSYSASITQDESILGQLTIIIAQKQPSNYFATLMSFMLVTSLSALLFFFYKIKINFIKPSTEVEHSEEHTTTPPDSIESSNIYLLIQFKNIENVFKQLSKEVREQRYQAIHSSIGKTLKIYNGEIIASDTESLLIVFNNNEETQAVINASCCAGVINLIATKEQWFIKMNHVIYQTDNEIGSIDNLIALQHIKQQPNNGIYIHETLEKDIVKISDTQALTKKALMFLVVTQFNQQYQQLLDNQCQHLTSTGTSD